MKLDAHVLGALRVQEADRLIAVKGHFGISVVAAHDDVVGAGELDELVVEVHFRASGGGIVRIVDEHEFRVFRHVRGDRAQVRQKIIFRGKGHEMHLPVREIRPDLVNGIGRIRNEHVVAGVHERQGDMGDALLRANQGDHLGSRIERNPEPRPIPVGARLAVGRHALIGGILVIRGFSGSHVEFFDDVGRGRQIRVAYTQTDDVHSESATSCFILSISAKR